MSTGQATPPQSPIRVFVSYSPRSMAAEGIALIGELKKHGATVSGRDPSLGEDWSRVISKEIINADLMVLLIKAGDELRKSVQYETRVMLQSCWERPAARIAVIAPAVGAIPRALRHQPFVSYYPHDDVHLSRWGSDSYLERFVDQLLLQRSDSISEPPQQFTDDEIHDWRNRVVHTGADTLVSDPQQVSQLREKLLGDLTRMQDLITNAEASRTRIGRNEIDRIYDRIMIARAMGDSALATDYYRIIQRIYEMNPPTSPAEEAGFQYGFALAAFDARDFVVARELLEQAAATDERILGRYHPATISAKQLLGLTYANLRDGLAAIKTLEDAFSRANESLGPNHPQTAEIAYSLGVLNKDQGNVQAARNLFELAYEAYRNVRPEDSLELRRVTEQLASLESDHA